MFKQFIFINLICALIFSNHLSAQTFQSENTQTQLLELYSSQGCSSCPPAERWVSKQLTHPQLWKQFIPIVFHVDYWDYLGWKDPFSSHIHSQRQRRHHHQGNINSVYTPGMLINGEEWRGWYRGRKIPVSQNIPGVLTAELIGDDLIVKFPSNSPLILNVTLLGFNIQTNVLKGENKGKQFSENFVVLSKQSAHSNNGQWKIKKPVDNRFLAKRYALALWVSKADSLQPLQSTGGWIE